MNTDCVPTQNGGKSSLTSQKWLQEIAAEENCLLDHPTKHVLTTRILDQMGKGGSFKACEMPNSYARARMWKMTNVGGRWHHYYFVLTKENILYYFADADDTEIRTGILLEGCSLRNDDSISAVEREGQNAVDLGNSVTDTSTLVAADVPEKSGHSHKFHFILDTPSRPYTFACNTMEQKFAWMILLKRAIIAADKIVDAE